MIQPAPPPALVASAPAVPLPATVIVSCSVAPGGTTRDCTTQPDPGHPGAAEAVIASLQAHPLRLPGAPAYQVVTIGLLRANLGKSRPYGLAPAKPYEPADVAVDPSAELARYYPERAMRMMAQGESLVRCKVTEEGRLDECWIRGEAPRGMGFGVAELVLATQAMHVTPPGPDAPAYDWRAFDVPMSWRLPAAGPTPASSP